MASSDYQHEWADYLALIEQRYGKAARDVAEAQGSAAAGEAAAIRGRQRMSWRSRMMHRRRRR